MGITIKELNLSLHIGESDSSEKDANKQGQMSLNDDCCTNQKQHDAIVNDTVRQVLEILKEQQER